MREFKFLILFVLVSSLFSSDRILSESEIKALKVRASKGDRDACFEYADYYSWNYSTDYARNESFIWMKKAAELGHKEAQVVYSGRLICSRNKELEIEGYEFIKSNVNLNKNLRSNLAVCYSYGRGTVKDEKEALRIYKEIKCYSTVANIYKSTDDYYNCYIWTKAHMERNKIKTKYWNDTLNGLKVLISREEEVKAEQEVANILNGVGDLAPKK